MDIILIGVSMVNVAMVGKKIIGKVSSNYFSINSKF
jgi:hypothetical protein